MTPASKLPGYSTGEAARLLGLPESRVRSWVSSGFVDPRRGPQGELSFSFQDLVVLKAAKGLTEADISSRRVRKALDRLREQLPAGRTLAGLKIGAEGHHIVVREGEDVWEPESGQRVLDFPVAELAEQAAPLAPATLARAQAIDGLNADEWFELGCDLEAPAPDEASAAYLKVLELDPAHTDAHLNLGRLQHEAGDVEAAERHYRAASEADPADATATFNLGVALQDLGRAKDAVDAYRRAVESDPDYADAYFNLADLYEKLGKEAMAIQNLKIYRRLTRG
jgi:tetratricopeptide (TPR) repeat protein